MNYKGYIIAPDLTGYAPKEEAYTYFEHGSGDEPLGSCETIEQCIKEIDKLIIKNISTSNGILFYLVNNKEKIACTKKLCSNKKYINFVDCETDGEKYSFTIEGNFSIKNIEKFLKSKFHTYKIIT